MSYRVFNYPYIEWNHNASFASFDAVNWEAACVLYNDTVQSNAVCESVFFDAVFRSELRDRCTNVNLFPSFFISICFSFFCSFVPRVAHSYTVECR